MEGTLHQCFFNDTCRRNFALKNRKTRVCRSCPLKAAYGDDAETLGMIEKYIRSLDAVHEFYRYLGIREKVGTFPEETLRLQLLHENVVNFARENSKLLPSGLIDNNEGTRLSGGALMRAMADQLSAYPIEVRERYFRL